MFKLPVPPSPGASVSELADFAELLCWINGRASNREIIAYLGRMDDNKLNDGCEDTEDEHINMLEDVFDEIDRRREICGSGYPFALESKGTVLKNLAHESIEPEQMVYLYLLLSTRLDMARNKTYAGIDGTSLLEYLSAHALYMYLGDDKVESVVFAALTGDKFSDKVTSLCNLLQEGYGYEKRHGLSNHAKDDKLDVVAWIPFPDNSPGQLIVFAQCKTGTNWKDSISQLQPKDFIDKWMYRSPFVSPVRAFCVSESIDSSEWANSFFGAGLPFDRCRLVKYSSDLDQETLDRMRKWILEANKSLPYEWRW